MKAWINISAAIFAAGMLAALADEPKTNAPAGTTAGIPANTNEVAVPPAVTATSAPAPAVVHKVKPPVVVPMTQTNAIPAQAKISAAPPAMTNAIAPSPLTTSTSAPPATGEMGAPEEASMMPTNTVPAESNIAPAAPTEGSWTGRKTVWAISVALLVVVGGLAVFMLRRRHTVDHASLITRAMSETKDEDKDTGKHEDKPEEKHGDTEEIKKFPPPMT